MILDIILDSTLGGFIVGALLLKQFKCDQSYHVYEQQNRIDIESLQFEIKKTISMFCEKRKRVVLAGSELFNTHYHGIDDTPTQEAYHGLNVTPNANGFNCNTALNWSQLEE